MTWAEFTADLAELLPIDAQREGSIQLVDRLTRACMINLQGVIPRLKVRTTTPLDSSSVQAVGFSSLGTVPSSGSIEIVEAWLVRTATGGVFKTGHCYRITTLGDTDFVAIGAAANTVGLDFVASGPGSGSGTAEEGRAELDQTPWGRRFQMIKGIEQNFLLALDPAGAQFYVAPKLMAGDVIEIVWVGVKMTFSQKDELPDNWDAEVVKAVSLYVKGHIARQIDNDLAASNTYMRDYASDRRSLFAREKARQLTAKK